MSAIAERAIAERRSPGEPGGRGGARRPAAVERAQGALAHSAALPFVLLATYGMLRWQTLLPSSMRWRCAGLLVLGLLVALLTGRALRVARPTLTTGLPLSLALAAVLAMLPVAGLPLSWITHLRVAVTLRAIGDGITALPQVTVPYAGHDLATRAVIALGGGMLLVGAALALATAELDGQALHRAMAAFPLIVLAAVPSALGRPRLIWVHGLALLILLVLFVFRDRVGRRHVLRPLAMLAIAAAVAIPVSAGLDGARPWFSLTRLVSGLGPPPTARFDWNQTYGPLGAGNSGSGVPVLRVRAGFASYWKTEGLDQFDGIGWQTATGSEAAALAAQQALAGVSQTASSRWTQQLTVTVGAMTTNRLVAAGVAGFPVGDGQALAVEPAVSPGSWIAETALTRADVYHVDVYTPRPNAAELANAGTHYPQAITDTELGMELPAGRASTAPAESVSFTPYGSLSGIDGGSGLTPAMDLGLLNGSAYAPVYRLAQRLLAGTHTPYQYVLSVMRYLGHGYRYTRHPPRVRVPIPGFLFRTRSGYCQQFAGAMALLLRMGGVPARVAVGFTTGTYDARTHEYVVNSNDAHAWVEAWFPRYGWVTFDPTPAGAQTGTSGAVDQAHRPKPIPATPTHRLHRAHVSHAARTAPPTPAAVHRHAIAPTVVGPTALFGALMTLVLASGLWFRRLTRRPGARRRIAPEALVVELERAFRLCGRPLGADVTLSALERRVASADRSAAAYVARLRTARFGTERAIPSADERRAMRRWLSRGMGPLGRVRAILALPPRRLN